MSTMTAAPQIPAENRDRASWTVLTASVLILVVAALLAVSGLLVRLGNDHEGHSILPPTVGAGESASGQLKLSNAGLLPVEVYLEPRTGNGLADTSLPSGLSVIVRRVSDGAYLYQGPMTTSMGPLEVIQPGQSSEVELTVRSDETGGTAAVPINFTYFWAARVALPWWWWIPAALLIAAFLAYGYRRKRARGA
ncbi:MAG TPA: hypothetical protein VNG93_04075 [Candidatus Dormibacteraeota bacterium]|nr:hypothetical protein [Candidatus Dormibacteraeota bacterium]